MENYFWGRRVLLNEIDQTHNKNLLKIPCHQLRTMNEETYTITCLRCGTVHEKEKVRITLSKINDEKQNDASFFYCPIYIQLGRVQSNQAFFHLPQPQHLSSSSDPVFAWQGNLSPNQKKASIAIVQAIIEKRNYLIWAVTGAGKTEMLFQGIYDSLVKGKRICLASPRVDVCLELFPRIKEAFPVTEMILLYGKQEEAYSFTPFVLCTTHQLLRFYQAFDVLIVDEVDAFPFKDNKVLEYGVKNALKKESTLIYLTATPSEKLKTNIQEKSISYTLVPARYHGYPLPVPRIKWIWQWRKKIFANHLPLCLKKDIAIQLNKRRKTLVFCPNILLMESMMNLLKKEFPKSLIDSVYAADSLREEKVLRMRKSGYDLLLTTTILERGVTFTDIDVFVVGANHPVFNEAALVQISGRVGRNQAFPSGTLNFYHDGISKSMKQAIKEIEKMNRIAKEERLLR